MRSLVVVMIESKWWRMGCGEVRLGEGMAVDGTRLSDLAASARTSASRGGLWE